MKNSCLALLVAALMTAGCAGSSSTAESASWWNPVSWHWSALSPTHWFGSSLTVSENGVGEVNASTAMSETAIDQGLGGGYRLRQGMRSEGGSVVSFWQALNDDKQVQLELSGQSTVSRVDVSDAGIKTDAGVKIGTSFSDLYSKAFGACQKGEGADSAGVECKAAGSQHISYLFSGDWHGPEGLMPSDDTLKSWKISKIIWRKG